MRGSLGREFGGMLYYHYTPPQPTKNGITVLRATPVLRARRSLKKLKSGLEVSDSLKTCVFNGYYRTALKAVPLWLDVTLLG